MTLRFYTNPQSRGAIVRWMLEELGQPYETILLDYGTSMKGADYLALNPMGKVPAISHDGQIVTETAAICTYLAQAFPEAGLFPKPEHLGRFYRWMFFAAGPVDSAVTNNYLKWQPTPEQQMMVGYGDFDRVIAVLETAVEGRSFIAGDIFSAADVYVGSQIDWGLQFGTMPSRPVLEAYVKPLRERPAYKRAKEIDAAAKA